jgi:hypothetical protein
MRQEQPGTADLDPGLKGYAFDILKFYKPSLTRACRHLSAASSALTEKVSR